MSIQTVTSKKDCRRCQMHLHLNLRDSTISPPQWSVSQSCESVSVSRHPKRYLEANTHVMVYGKFMVVQMAGFWIDNRKLIYEH